MRTISRRQLLGGAAGAYLASGALTADPLGMPIGTQTWPVRESLVKDFPGTLKTVAEMGFKTIEMCSPAGYGWKNIAALKPAEVKKIINDAGLRCESSHYQFGELKNSLDDRIDYAMQLNLKQMVLSTFGLPNAASMADWLKAADDLNKIGERVKKAGMQMGFHNHQFEFREIEGALIYDKLMGAFDPKLIKMQFQVAVINLGYKATTYLDKYPGRFISLHLADWAPAEKKQVAVGKGSVVWKELFQAAKKCGVKNYFVEVDQADMKDSVTFLRGLKV